MREVLKKKEFFFDTIQYTLIVYFQRRTTVEEIGNKAGKKNEEVKKEMKGEWNIEPAAILLTPDKVSRSYMIFNDEITVGVLQHEVIHVVWDIFEKSNLNHNTHTDEMFAYYSQHIFEKLVSYVINDLKIPAKGFLNA